MPFASNKQKKYIYFLRNKYTNISNTPEKYKWVWNKDWDNTVSKLTESPDKVLLATDSEDESAPYDSAVFFNSYNSFTFGYITLEYFIDTIITSLVNMHFEKIFEIIDREPNEDTKIKLKTEQNNREKKLREVLKSQSLNSSNIQIIADFVFNECVIKQYFNTSMYLGNKDLFKKILTRAIATKKILLIASTNIAFHDGLLHKFIANAHKYIIPFHVTYNSREDLIYAGRVWFDNSDLEQSINYYTGYVANQVLSFWNYPPNNTSLKSIISDINFIISIITKNNLTININTCLIELADNSIIPVSNYKTSTSHDSSGIEHLKSPLDKDNSNKQISRPEKLKRAEKSGISAAQYNYLTKQESIKSKIKNTINELYNNINESPDEISYQNEKNDNFSNIYLNGEMRKIFLSFTNSNSVTFGYFPVNRVIKELVKNSIKLSTFTNGKTSLSSSKIIPFIEYCIENDVFYKNSYLNDINFWKKCLSDTDNKLILFCSSGTMSMHGNIWNKYNINSNNREIFDSWISGADFVRKNYIFAGRLWQDLNYDNAECIMSFWKYPKSRQDLDMIINHINMISMHNTNIKKINKNKLWIDSIIDRRYQLIKYNNYLTSNNSDLIDIDHIKSPLDKNNNKQIISRPEKLKNAEKGNITAVQYNYLTKQESIKSLVKKTISETLNSNIQESPDWVYQTSFADLNINEPISLDWTSVIARTFGYVSVPNLIDFLINCSSTLQNYLKINKFRPNTKMNIIKFIEYCISQKCFKQNSYLNNIEFWKKCLNDTYGKLILLIADKKTPHSDLLEHDDVGINVDNTVLFDYWHDNSFNKLQDRNAYTFAGRLWQNLKYNTLNTIISFWDYPTSKQELIMLITHINAVKVIDNTIQQIDTNKCAIEIVNDKRKHQLIKFDNYLKSNAAIDIDIDHFKSPLDKDNSNKQISRPDTLKQAEKSGITAAQYNYLTKQESIKSLVKKTIKESLNIQESPDKIQLSVGTKNLESEVFFDDYDSYTFGYITLKDFLNYIITPLVDLHFESAYDEIFEEPDDNTRNELKSNMTEYENSIRKTLKSLNTSNIKILTDFLFDKCDIKYFDSTTYLGKKQYLYKILIYALNTKKILLIRNTDVTYHSNLLSSFVDEEYELLLNLSRFSYDNSRDNLLYAGRVWFDNSDLGQSINYYTGYVANQVLSFWNYPENRAVLHSIMLDINFINMLSPKFCENIDINKCIVELADKSIISFNSYKTSTSHDSSGIEHIKSPIDKNLTDKHNIHRPDKLKNAEKGNITAAQYNYLTKKESIKSLVKKTISEKLSSNIQESPDNIELVDGSISFKDFKSYTFGYITLIDFLELIIIPLLKIHVERKSEYIDEESNEDIKIKLKKELTKYENKILAATKSFNSSNVKLIAEFLFKKCIINNYFNPKEYLGTADNVIKLLLRAIDTKKILLISNTQNSYHYNLFTNFINNKIYDKYTLNINKITGSSSRHNLLYTGRIWIDTHSGQLQKKINYHTKYVNYTQITSFWYYPENAKILDSIFDDINYINKYISSTACPVVDKNTCLIELADNSIIPVNKYKTSTSHDSTGIEHLKSPLDKDNDNKIISRPDKLKQAEKAGISAAQYNYLTKQESIKSLVKKTIIKESTNTNRYKQINESPDNIKYALHVKDNKIHSLNLNWSNSNAVPFGYILTKDLYNIIKSTYKIDLTNISETNKIIDTLYELNIFNINSKFNQYLFNRAILTHFIQNKKILLLLPTTLNITHSSLLKNKIFSQDFINLLSEFGQNKRLQSRNNLILAGRCWHSLGAEKLNIFSFWGYPQSYTDMKNILDDINLTGVWKNLGQLTEHNSNIEISATKEATEKLIRTTSKQEFEDLWNKLIISVQSNFNNSSDDSDVKDVKITEISLLIPIKQYVSPPSVSVASTHIKHVLSPIFKQLAKNSTSSSNKTVIPAKIKNAEDAGISAAQYNYLTKQESLK